MCASWGRGRGTGKRSMDLYREELVDIAYTFRFSRVLYFCVSAGSNIPTLQTQTYACAGRWMCWSMYDWMNVCMVCFVMPTKLFLYCRGVVWCVVCAVGNVAVDLCVHVVLFTPELFFLFSCIWFCWCYGGKLFFASLDLVSWTTRRWSVECVVGPQR